MAIESRFERIVLTTVAGFAMASLGGCASQRTFLACDDRTTIVVTFEGETARLEQGDRSVSLRARPAASGIWYVGEGHELRGKGPESTWTDPEGEVRHCRDEGVDRTRSPNGRA